MDWENHLIKHIQWSDTIINREAKEHVAREIAAIAKDGETVGSRLRIHRLPDAVRTWHGGFAKNTCASKLSPHPKKSQ